ncbi:hypothetical protein [Asaia prunellae]|uniref:hypothetical protein n=1 Tax=Asaia prunellae TaxID=610245 RepID=UPI00046EA1B5|nr:hypothetical protein [Asaia prunellae]
MADYHEPQRNPWFRAKKYGYGSGLPITWQGWVSFGLVLGILLMPPLFMSFVAERYQPGIMIVYFAVSLLAMTLFFFVCKTHTRGGWRWRWGNRD